MHFYRFNLVENELCQCGEDEESIDNIVITEFKCYVLLFT